jgi:hypothetical protein
MKNLAPIAIFTYNRLDFLKILIRSLKKNSLSRNSTIYFFSDNWKDAADKKKVLEVRNFIKKISCFKKTIIILRDKNYGLAKNVISGINFVLKNNKKIIVLEDDLELSKNFLKYINNGLNIYRNNKKVASVHGWSFPINYKKYSPDYFFIRGADCWGWGTWKRAWKKFNPDGKDLVNKIKSKNLKKLFNFNNSFNYFKMLEDQVLQKNNSWAIRWYASMFLENMYTLYPKISLVKNNGTKYGTHSNFDILNLGKNFTEEKYKPILKKQVKEDLVVIKQIQSFYNMNYFFKIKEFLKKFL